MKVVLDFDDVTTAILNHISVIVDGSVLFNTVTFDAYNRQAYATVSYKEPENDESE